MMILYYYIFKWKENKQMKLVIRRLLICQLVELGMYIVFKLKSEFIFFIIDENDLKYYIKKMIIFFFWLVLIKFRK